MPLPLLRNKEVSQQTDTTSVKKCTTSSRKTSKRIDWQEEKGFNAKGK